jgi:predicted ester cyclase
MVAEDDKVAVQVTFEGTHIGTYGGFAPTNKVGRFTDMQILRFDRGKIVESSLGSGGLRYFFALLNGTLFDE